MNIAPAIKQSDSDLDSIRNSCDVYQSAQTFENHMMWLFSGKGVIRWQCTLCTSRQTPIWRSIREKTTLFGETSWIVSIVYWSSDHHIWLKQPTVDLIFIFTSGIDPTNLSTSENNHLRLIEHCVLVSFAMNCVQLIPKKTLVLCNSDICCFVFLGLILSSSDFFLQCVM